MNKKVKYFKLEEFLTSETARKKSIQNLPSWEIIEHLKELALFLDTLREDWGSAIKVNSGYRTSVLNVAVGGVPTSIHKLGYAADIVPANGKLNEFIAFLKEWSKDKAFDQIIIEESKKATWIHIGLYNNNGQQRRRVFKLDA